MRQELIDLLLGELEPAEADVLKARLRAEPALRRELADLESLFGLMRRSEEIEPVAATRAALVAAAARARPPLLVRLRTVPGLFAYRFRHSVRFRVAIISVCAHLVLIAVLAQVLLGPGGREQPPGPIIVTAEMLPAEQVKPAPDFMRRLSLRRLLASNRLRQYGVARQEEAIWEGLDALVASQRPDGSFDGDAAETGYSAMALLAQGDSSVLATPRGHAIRMACLSLLSEAKRGTVHGSMLAALVENFGLSYASLDEFEQREYLEAIRKLILAVPDADISREALLLAHLAGFAIPAGRDLGEAQLVVSGDRTRLLALEPTRFRATVAFARGRSSPEPERARIWAAPLFERAMADLRSGNASALVLLTLQSPYRL